MDLATLSFSVDTSQLDTAIQKVEKLTIAVSDLNKVNDKTSAVSSAAAAASKKLASEQENLGNSTEKTNDKLKDSEKLLERLKNQYSDLTDGFTKGESSILNQARSYGILGESLEPFRAQLKLIKELTKDPFDASIGAIRSVSAELEKLNARSTLASQGIALSNKQLEEYSRLASEVKGKVIQMGIDPASAEGQAKLNQMLKETQEQYLGIARTVNQMTSAEKELNAVLKQNEKIQQYMNKQYWDDYSASVGKTSNEIKELNEWYKGLEAESNRMISANEKVAASIARIEEITRMVKSGMSEGEASKRYDLGLQGVDSAAINKIIAAEKELTSTRKTGLGVDREKATALKYVERETERLAIVLKELNRTNEDGTRLDEKHARSMANFERNLRLAGISGEEATAKLKAFRDIQAKITDLEEKRKIGQLQRGLQPQIGDVAVSLAAGQNPLTVMLQQGDQIRGLIAQTGLQGKALQEAFSSAMSGTVESIKLTAGAMVNLLGGAIASTGKSILGLVTGPFVALSDGLKQAKKDGENLSTGFGTGLVNAIKSVGTALASMETLLLGGVIAGLTAMGVALYQVTKLNDDLVRSVTLFSGATGLSTREAYGLAASFSEIPKTKALEYITALAEGGNYTRTELAQIIPVADDMVKYLGMSLKDVKDKFDDLKKSPTESLIALQRNTGLVSTEAITLAAEAERMGNKVKAGWIAAAEGVKVFQESIKTAKEDLTEFGKFMIAVRKYGESFWNGFQSKFATSKIDKQLNDLKRNLADAELNQSLFGSSWDQDVKQAKKELDDFNVSLGVNSKVSESAARRNVQVAEALKNAAGYAKEARTPSQKYIEQIIELNKEYDLLTGRSKEQAAVQDKINKVTKEYSDAVEKQLKEKVKENKIDDARQAAINLYNTTTQKLINIREEALGKTKELTKAEIAYNEALSNKDSKKITPKEIESLKALRDQAIAQEKLKEYALEEKKIKEGLIKYDDRRYQLASSLTIEYMKQSEALAKENDSLDLRLAVLGKTEDEVKAITREYQRQAELRAADAEFEVKRAEIWKKFVDAQDKTEGAVFDIDGYERAIKQAEEIRVQKGYLANKKIAVSAAEEYQKEFDRITNGISDAIVTSLFEGGKAGSKKLRDVIVAELRKPITVVVKAVVEKLTGGAIDGFLNMLGVSKSGNSGSSAGALGDLSSLAGLMNAGKGLYSLAEGAYGAYSAGGLSAGANYANIYSGNAYGTAFGSQQSAQLAAQESGFGLSGGSSSSSASGGAAQTLAYAYIGRAAGQAISNGYSAWGGESGNSAVNTGVAVGAAIGSIIPVIGTAVGALVGGLIGGVVNVAFGTKLKEKGIEGTFGPDGFNGNAFEFRKGGWFRSDKTTTSTLDSGIDQGLDSQFQIMKLGAKELANTLGLSTEAIDNFSYSMKVNLKDLSDSQITDVLGKEFDTMSNMMAGAILGVQQFNQLNADGTVKTSEYNRQGENNVQTLKRLSDTLGGINNLFKNLGWTLYETSIAGFSAADSFINLFGGLDKMSTAVNSYYENFYTEAEKLAASKQQIKDTLIGFGIKESDLPTDRIQYRKLIEKAMLDGNEELAVNLIKLSQAFASITEPLDAATEAVNSVSDVLKNLQQEQKQLGIELLEVTGQTEAAKIATRSLATEGMSALEVAAWDSNQALRDQIQTAKAAAEEQKRIQDEAIAKQKQAADQKYNLESQLLQLQGNTTAIRERELAALDPTNQELQKLIWSLEETKNAAEVAAQAEAARNSEKYNLESQLLQVQGDTNALRARELATLDPTNQELQKLIWSLQDTKDAAAAAAQAEAARNQEAYGLDTQLLQLQGNTAKLRERELALLDEANRPRQLEIWALQDLQAEQAKAAQATAQQAQEAQQAAEAQAQAAAQLKEAWQSITDTIFEEVRRIRGLTDSGPTNLANAQTAFDVATAKARAGDQEAAKALPDLSKTLLELAGQQANSLVALRRIQMLTAANLEQTGTGLVGQYGLTIPAFASGGSYGGGMALVGEQGPELINFNKSGQVYNSRSTASMLNNSNLESLVERLNENLELLRYEVRADVSHNAKTAKILDRAMKDGTTLSVSFETAQEVTVV